MESYRRPDTSMTNFGILNANTINLINATPSSNSNTSINSDGSNNKPAHTNTFVHKLFNMVLDDQFQHLIAWNYTGSSFIVCNIMEFSKDVLPKHFKHNNFSSFVRQLNMYGFHKVNKSPRGHRTSAENQIWEFSHTKFLRGRSDLLDDIKRKAMENDNTKHQGDIQQHLTMLQMSQTDMIQQIHHLFDKCNHVVKELGEAKKRQESQALVIKQLAQLISHQNGGRLPVEFNLEGLSLENNNPSIFITSHEPMPSNNNSNNTFNIVSSTTESYHYQDFSPTPVSSPLTVRTQSSPPRSPHYQPITGLSPTTFTAPTSLSSTPTGLMASDDDASLYSPHTPTDSNRQNTFYHHYNQCK